MCSPALAGVQGQGVLDDALALPGVLYAEGGFALPVRLRAGSESRLTSLEARPGVATLARLLGGDGRPVDLPPEGLLLPELLASDLGLQPGDMVLVELMVAPRETWEARLAGTIRRALGQGAYMAEEAVFARLGRAPQVAQINPLVDETQLPALYAQIKQTPAVAGVMLWAEVRRIDPAAFTRVSALGIEEQRVRLRLVFLDPPETRAGLGDRFRVHVRVVVWSAPDSVAGAGLGAVAAGHHMGGVP